MKMVKRVEDATRSCRWLLDNCRSDPSFKDWAPSEDSLCSKCGDDNPGECRRKEEVVGMIMAAKNAMQPRKRREARRHSFGNHRPMATGKRRTPSKKERAPAKAKATPVQKKKKIADKLMLRYFSPRERDKVAVVVQAKRVLFNKTPSRLGKKREKEMYTVLRHGYENLVADVFPNLDDERRDGITLEVLEQRSCARIKKAKEQSKQQRNETSTQSNQQSTESAALGGKCNM